MKAMWIGTCGWWWVFAGGALGNINLELRPPLQNVQVGQTAQVALYAVSDNGGNQLMAAADVILGWDPAVLGLLGNDNTGAVPLLVSAFPTTDPYHLNEVVPPQDGDGLYLAYAFGGMPVVATPAGVMLTTFRFTGLANSSGSLVRVLTSAGSPLGPTVVYDGTTPGLDVTGTLGSATVVVGVPAAVVTDTLSRRANTSGPGGLCDLTLLPVRKSEPRAGGVTQVRVTFDVPPGGPGPNPVTIVQATCAAPVFVPYAGAAVVSASVAGNELVLNFSPALENVRTYRMTIGPGVTTVAGQTVEVRGLFGDVNSDGQTNALDRSFIVGEWTGSGFSCPTDVNNDGATNALDRSFVVGAWTGLQNCAP